MSAWERIRQLDGGGQGTVDLVRDGTGAISQPCVRKSLRKNPSEKARTRFKQEVQAALTLEHPNALRIYSFDSDAERPYYIAEYCENGSLEERGAAEFKGDIRVTVSVILPILDALTAFHEKRMFHRDVKPSNILFRKDGTPVLGDFGLCYVEGSEGVTSLDEAVGSRHFIAPEMESGGRDLGLPDDRTDVYSLGKVMYWMVSGGLRFDRERHRTNSLVQLLSDQKWEHVHMLLDRMVTERPKDRLRSAEIRGYLETVSSLVAGAFAPLKPSIGIRCRFCGIGEYQLLRDPAPLHTLGGWARDPGAGLGDVAIVGIRLNHGVPFENLRLLRRSHCGHVQWFQSGNIGTPDWWSR